MNQMKLTGFVPVSCAVLDGSGAVAVAEHAPAHLAAEFTHLAAFVASRDNCWVGHREPRLLGDVEVLLGDGLVGDPGVEKRPGRAGAPPGTRTPNPRIKSPFLSHSGHATTSR